MGAPIEEEGGAMHADARDVFMDIFDVLDEGLACRVCGALVPAQGDYARVHWDWHEAASGA
jgi:hypothetical protein